MNPDYPVPGYESRFDWFKDHGDRPHIDPVNTPEDDLEKVEELLEKQENGGFEDKPESFIICFVQIDAGLAGPQPVVKGEDLSWVKELLEKQVELHEKLENRGE